MEYMDLSSLATAITSPMNMLASSASSARTSPNGIAMSSKNAHNSAASSKSRRFVPQN